MVGPGSWSVSTSLNVTSYVAGNTTAPYRSPSIAEIDYVKDGPDGYVPTNGQEKRQLDRTGHPSGTARAHVRRSVGTAATLATFP